MKAFKYIFTFTALLFLTTGVMANQNAQDRLSSSEEVPTKPIEVEKAIILFNFGAGLTTATDTVPENRLSLRLKEWIDYLFS